MFMKSLNEDSAGASDNGFSQTNTQRYKFQEHYAAADNTYLIEFKAMFEHIQLRGFSFYHRVVHHSQLHTQITQTQSR